MTPVVERPPKQKLTWLWVLLGCLGCGFVLLIIVPAILFPFLMGTRQTARAANCESNLRELSRAFEMYCADWNGHYPDTAQWTDALYPYMKTENILKCPEAAFMHSYAVNSKLAFTDAAAIGSPATKPQVYDSDTGLKNANDACTSLPSPGRHEEGHIGGNNVAFCDSHVEFVPSTRKLKP